mmetsp:Transcript_56748/g.134799  ORF Transcript_56748/g.134799 Transcript_56748/m.134799 type:complete len:261 (-) Transcript_56748:574-1356(-)
MSSSAFNCASRWASARRRWSFNTSPSRVASATAFSTASLWTRYASDAVPWFCSRCSSSPIWFCVDEVCSPVICNSPTSSARFRCSSPRRSRLSTSPVCRRSISDLRETICEERSPSLPARSPCSAVRRSSSFCCTGSFFSSVSTSRLMRSISSRRCLAFFSRASLALRSPSAWSRYSFSLPSIAIRSSRIRVTWARMATSFSWRCLIWNSTRPRCSSSRADCSAISSSTLRSCSIFSSCIAVASASLLFACAKLSVVRSL